MELAAVMLRDGVWPKHIAQRLGIRVGVVRRLRRRMQMELDRAERLKMQAQEVMMKH